MQQSLIEMQEEFESGMSTTTLDEALSFFKSKFSVSNEHGTKETNLNDWDACVNYVSGFVPAFDSSVFSGAARHMMDGRVLYKDIWDHKPPMVYLINLGALKFYGPTLNSIHYVERIFSIAGAVAMFFVVWGIFKKRWLAFITALFYLLHMYYPYIFD